MLSLYARNDHPGILITCPHCKMAARHDSDDIGNAIKEHKPVECVLCGKSFSVFVEVASSVRRPTMRAMDLAYDSHCPECGTRLTWCAECEKHITPSH